MDRRKTIALLLSSVLAFSPLAPTATAFAQDDTVEAQSDGTVTMYRLYNEYSGEHFYTYNLDERSDLIGVGWTDEGVGWIAPETSKTPVYRLYNQYNGEHHYTTSASERNDLVKVGWTDEGVGWYSDDNKTVALYRQFNPYVTIGTHNYTTSAEENDYLVDLGWIGEGIAWYALNDDGHTPVEESLIYIDAGHGKSGSSGYDSGAIGNGYIEADETKELVTMMADIAKDKYGLNLYVNIDCDRPYTERQAHAKEVGASCLVSIHFNSTDSAQATGFESYIYRPYDQYTGLAAPGSETMQEIMHNALASALDLPDRGMRSDAFAVLNGRKTGIPATLLEICFISNPNDMKTYKATERKVAEALAAGLYDIYLAGF